MKRERLGALTQFTASPTAIAFPVVLDDDEEGLVFIDRRSGRSKLIYEKDKQFWSPRLSVDEQRLVLIQRHVGLARKEIISCSTASWQCAEILRTEDNLRSPVELDASTIIFAASPLFVGSDGRHRYMHWDLYLSKKESVPVQLTDFRLYKLDGISATDGKLVFDGAGSKVLPESIPLSPNRSDVYAVEFDQMAQNVRRPSLPLAPLFRTVGYSASASVSRGGRLAAVLNTRTDRGPHRYDMVLAMMDGSMQRRIAVEGIGFSRGEFVGETLVFNELFEDRYDVRLFDFTDNSLKSIFSVEHAPAKLRALEQVRLAVDRQSQIS